MDTGEAVQATAAARWLLAAGEAGVPLTQTHALARSVVREAAERWPEWWNAELFGPPHREADLPVLAALHEGLRRLRLVRRRGRTLHTTVRGRELAADAGALLGVLAGDLGAGDGLTAMVAAGTVEVLGTSASATHDELLAPLVRTVRRQGWRGPAGESPGERDVSWVMHEVLRRGEAYGLIVWQSAGHERRLQVRLSRAGRVVLGVDREASAGMAVLVFDAELANVRVVRARLAVRSDHSLTALHDAIQEAFGWLDDHLYSFWLDGVFWGDDELEYTTPVAADEAEQTADVPLAELDLAVGATIAYIFDFGDEWRVRLTLRETDGAPEPGPYPRVLSRTGQAPPQYPALDEE